MKNYKHAPALINSWLTSFYDPVMNMFGVGTLFQKKTLDIVTLQEGQKLLDIGCGTGTLVMLVKTKHPKAKVTGLDPDQHVLAIAKRKAERSNHAIDFIQAGAEKLPFASSSFDIITSSLAFHHLPTTIKKQALGEIYRVLKPTGQFLLVDIGKPKNLLWKILLAIESIVEPKEYIKDNLEGKLPAFMIEAGFALKEVRKPYLSIQFLMGTKKS
ncbi:MAG TPA: class I SAM-dependent methyltransferase [Patescibacteria group bacterium]|nr:class I SAM-dependent methyltransferase [Patescibacteria group bacterium]